MSKVDDDDQGQKNSAEDLSEEEALAKYVKFTETAEWREEARLGMTVTECFNQTLGPLNDDNVCAAIKASTATLVRAALENPCCEDRSFSHVVAAIATTSAIWGFQAGARSGNLVGIEGLDHAPVPFPTDERVEEARLEYIAERQEVLLAAKNRVDQVVAELGLQRMDRDGVSGIVVKNTQQLQELLSRLGSGGEIQEEEDDDVPRGMYL